LPSEAFWFESFRSRRVFPPQAPYFLPARPFPFPPVVRSSIFPPSASCGGPFLTAIASEPDDSTVTHGYPFKRFGPTQIGFLGVFTMARFRGTILRAAVFIGCRGSLFFHFSFGDPFLTGPVLRPTLSRCQCPFWGCQCSKVGPLPGELMAFPSFFFLEFPTRCQTSSLSLLAETGCCCRWFVFAIALFFRGTDPSQNPMKATWTSTRAVLSCTSTIHAP